MTTIWKYAVDPQTYTVSMHSDCKIIHIGLDPNNHMCVWAEHDPDQTDNITVPVYVVGTGQPIPEEYTHFRSFRDGVFIWHVYC